MILCVRNKNIVPLYQCVKRTERKATRVDAIRTQALQLHMLSTFQRRGVIQSKGGG